MHPLRILFVSSGKQNGLKLAQTNNLQTGLKILRLIFPCNNTEQWQITDSILFQSILLAKCFKAQPGNLFKMDAVKLWHTCDILTCTENKAKTLEEINFLPNFMNESSIICFPDRLWCIKLSVQMFNLVIVNWYYSTYSSVNISCSEKYDCCFIRKRKLLLYF